MKMIAEDFKDVSFKGDHKCYMDQTWYCTWLFSINVFIECQSVLPVDDCSVIDLLYNISSNKDDSNESLSWCRRFYFINILMQYIIYRRWFFRSLEKLFSFLRAPCCFNRIVLFYMLVRPKLAILPSLLEIVRNAQNLCFLHQNKCETFTLTKTWMLVLSPSQICWCQYWFSWSKHFAMIFQFPFQLEWNNMLLN